MVWMNCTPPWPKTAPTSTSSFHCRTALSFVPFCYNSSPTIDLKHSLVLIPFIRLQKGTQPPFKGAREQFFVTILNLRWLPSNLRQANTLLEYTFSNWFRLVSRSLSISVEIDARQRLLIKWICVRNGAGYSARRRDCRLDHCTCILACPWPQAWSY